MRYARQRRRRLARIENARGRTECIRKQGRQIGSQQPQEEGKQTAEQRNCRIEERQTLEELQ